MISVFRGRTRKLATAIVLSLVHLGSQVAAIYAVYWYARQMEKTGIVTVPLLHFQLNLKDQPEWLWAIVIFSTACFVISAAFLYLSRQQLLNLVREALRAKHRGARVALDAPSRSPGAHRKQSHHGLRRGRPDHRLPARRLDRDWLCQRHNGCHRRRGRGLLPLSHRSPADAADFRFGEFGGFVPLPVDAARRARRQGSGKGPHGIQAGGSPARRQSHGQPDRNQHGDGRRDGARRI